MLNKHLNKVVRVFSFFVILNLSLGFVVNEAAHANPLVLMETSKGNIKIELFEKEAPITVKNFLSYVSEGFYDNLTFHRVIRGFMIQGGSFNLNMNKKKSKASIKNEATSGLINMKGTIAMARTNVIDSATSQFFINVADNGFLDHKNNTSRGFGYAVFGKVIEGMDVVTSIENVKTDSLGSFRDVPKEAIIIKNVRLVR